MKRKPEDIERLLTLMSESADQGAFEELFNIYYAWLHTVAVSIVRSTEDAEEIVEDVFLKMWEMREGFGRINNLETYLYTAVKNKSYDYYKKNSRVHLVEFENEWNDKEFVLSPEDAYLYEELKSKYQLAIARLPPKCKEVFNLVREEGYSYNKAAEIMGVSPRTIESSLRSAILKIRAELSKYLKSSANKLYVTFLLI